MSIPMLKPSCSQAEIDAVTEVLKSGWWGMGPKCAEFEERIAALHGYKYAVTVNSATAALHLALLLKNIGPGDEVILPALTFVSTGLAVLYAGARPVFADVMPGSLCIDWEDVERKTTHNTKACIPVDYGGYPAMRGADWFGVVIQDAAHATGGTGYGDLMTLSFHPVKNLATGDGGAILTNDAGEYERAKALRWCGINRSTYDRVQNRYGWDYDIRQIGYKCHWNDIQAAIGLAQLSRYEWLLDRRRRIAERYLEELDDARIVLPKEHGAHTWHLFPVRVNNRKRIMDYMLDRGISVGVHYKPLTAYPMFESARLPVTDREWTRLISLPIYADLSEEQQGQVISTLLEAVDYA